IKIVSDPLDAKVCVCDPARAMLAPRGMPLLVVRSGSVSDLAAAMSRPDASLVDRAGLAEAVRRALAEEMPGNPEGGRIGIPAPGLGEVLRDPLTGCYTRRCLEVLDLDPPCAVVFIDLDGFKEVNDTLGHDAGDGVLAAFGAVLRESLKGKDVPIRWGGDEFVLLLPGTAGADAERVVDGLRRAWRERAPDTGDLEVGFSAGVAEWRGGPLEAAVKEADRLMYAEKRTRKEREAARTGAPEGRRAPRREGRPNVYVLPGRKVEGGVAVPEHGAIYVACPGEPPAAGRIAAALARQVPGSALVCASGTSTAALALGMRPEDLVLSDWRVPGSDAPVSFGGVVVWPVDPGKFLGARDVPPHALVSQIRHRFPLVVVDCGGDLSLCAGAPRDAAVVVARTGGEASDWVVERWLRDYGGNALVVRAGEEIALEGVGGGFLLRAGEAAARDRHPRKL
uniref:GGDEF domain-containing protein n=1 Tax=Desulfovirgula thermocuniculi TaxID=348842 RepID=UPI0012EBDD97